MIDVAERVIALKGMGPVVSANEAIQRLVELGVLPAPHPCTEIISFRNLIVHLYDSVDSAVAFRLATERLGVFFTFRDAIERLRGARHPGQVPQQSLGNRAAGVVILPRFFTASSLSGSEKPRSRVVARAGRRGIRGRGGPIVETEFGEKSAILVVMLFQPDTAQGAGSFDLATSVADYRSHGPRE